MIYYNQTEQLSDEWFEARNGLMSASNATAIGANGSGLKTYCKKLARERMEIESESYTNSDMDRGNRLEPIAAQAYSFEFGVNIMQVGGVTNDKYKDVWVSPDGLIGDDGGCEIKARNNEKHHDLILGGTKNIPFNQIQMSLLISEREWWDFISFNPNFSKPLFVKRIYPDQAYFKKLIIGFGIGNKLIPQYIEDFKRYKPQL